MERAHLLRAKRCMLLFHRLASFFIMQFCSYSYSIILILFYFFHFFSLLDLLDAPTWMSMVEELWNEETEDACTLKALCRMNRLAIDAPGSTGIAVSISR